MQGVEVFFFFLAETNVFELLVSDLALCLSERESFSTIFSLLITTFLRSKIGESIYGLLARLQRQMPQSQFRSWSHLTYGRNQS